MAGSNRQKKRKEPITDATNIGKLPPQAVDLEETVLGAMLLEREAVEAAINIIFPECFYKEQNGRVCTAIFALYKRSEPVDILTVTQELKATGELERTGGSYYVSNLTSRVASSANVEYHARIVLQKFLQRELIRISTDSIREAYEDGTDVFELYAQHGAAIEEALSGSIKKDISHIGDVHADAVMDHHKTLEAGLPSGIPTGFRALDNFTNGWQPEDLIILAGRPGMGKTAAARAFALRSAFEFNIPTGFFSLEVSKAQFVAGCQSYLSDISFSKIVKKQLNSDELKYINTTGDYLYKTPLYIDDTPAISLLHLKAVARRMVKKLGVRQLFIDYLQLMTSGENIQNREQEISTISRGLKALARELKIPIIALSQLNRTVEGRADRRPNLSDLRESGAIEQDADMVMFAFRPEYYEMETFEVEGRQIESRGLFVLITAKHRAGALGDLVMGFIKENAKVVNWNPATMAPEATTLTHRGRDPAMKAPKDINTNTSDLAKPAESSTFVQEQEKQPGKMQVNTDFLNQGPSTGSGTESQEEGPQHIDWNNDPPF